MRPDDSIATASLHDRLISYLKEQPLALDIVFDAETRLFDSGLFDSMFLFNLALWIEQELAAPIDLSAFNLVEAWATVADIVDFIEQHRAPAG